MKAVAIEFKIGNYNYSAPGQTDETRKQLNESVNQGKSRNQYI